jgi:hypothetical protein
MSTTDIRFEMAKALDALAEELDVSPAKYKDAEDRYIAVCEWLGAEGSELAEYDPNLYPQGSFALGTAIRPLGDDHYDVDAVCLLDESAANITQKELKLKVGKRLKENDRYRKMLKPPDGGRRCWTLEYADASKFHLDILPAIPDPSWRAVGVHVPEAWAKHAIQITDKTTWDRVLAWPRSNPPGFALWFKDQMRIRLEEGRRLVAATKAASIADIPDYEVRTPLQRLVQILKRHRDMRYAGNEHRPISVIITTLAGLAYGNEANLADAIENVVPKMRTYVQTRDGRYWIPNPVNPAENFADKWAAEPEKARIFFEWLEAVEQDYHTLLTPKGFRERERHLAEAFGARDAGAALRKSGIPSSSGNLVIGAAAAALAGAAVATIAAKTLGRFNVPHREAPPWPMAPSLARIPLSARYKRNGTSRDFPSDSAPLPKGGDLMFYADGSAIPGAFDVYWQVVNTGREAASIEGGLRGQIKHSGSAGRGGLTQKEATAYTGSHWIECFIVQNGRCIARSGEYVVNIE